MQIFHDAILCFSVALVIKFCFAITHNNVIIVYGTIISNRQFFGSYFRSKNTL